MARTLNLFLDVGASDGNGLVRGLDTEVAPADLVFVAGDDIPVTVHLIERNRYEGGTLYRYIEDDTQLTVRLSVGDQDAEPTSGQWELGGSTLNYNATTSEVATAVDDIPVPGFTASVEQVGSSYLVKFSPVGSTGLSSIAVNAGSLLPLCNVSSEKLIAGDSDTNEVWRITIDPQGLAYLEMATDAPLPSLAETLVSANVQTGTTNLRAIQELDLSEAKPVGGKMLLSYTQAQKIKIVCVDDVSGSLDGKIVADIYDADGPVRIWLKESGGSAPDPDIPAGGRLMEITFTDGDTGTQIAGYLETSIEADASFSAVAVGNVLTITQASDGEREDPVVPTDNTGAGFGVSVITAGAGYSQLLPFDATTDEIAEALGDLWSVDEENGVYTFTATTNGVRAGIQMDTTRLLVPQGRTGILSFDEVATIQAFAGTTANSLTTKFSAQIQKVNEGPYTPALTNCTVYRSHTVAPNI